MNINEISMNIMKTRKSYKTPTTASKHHVKCNENQWKHDLLKSKHFGAPWPMAGQSHLHRLKRYAEPMRRGIPGPGCISGNQISSGCGLPDVRNNALETAKMLGMPGIALKNNNVASTEGFSQCAKAPKCVEIQ